MNFSKTVEGAAVVLRIEGSLDAMSTPELRPLIEELIAERVAQVTVDLSHLRLIDSSGVGAIVSLYKRMRAQGCHVVVRGLRDQPLAIFRLLRLDRVFAG
ncbi:MAG TPA: STAS domain-containing protein [Polyangia bacterium]|nr:STAS domain-containing protein [Polyangia bacterium]